ncbi:MAG TPA: hypothetical protein VMU19_13745 [Bryobacteraceae bacterium]|nr:hypothetical protein [Bryobacteraceae bacterium]
MITFTLVVILGALLAVVLMQLFRKPIANSGGSPTQAEPQDLANLKVTDARAGDAISISGAGDSMTDLDFTADRLTRFDAGARRWFELSGPYRERRVALRVGGDEEVETALHSDARKISIEDLGLSEGDLSQMDERQNTADYFDFDGKSWYYHFSREAHSWRDDGQKPVGFYYWEFQEQNGNRLLAVRKAEGEPFTVTVYAAVPPGDITIYRR